MLLRRLLFPGPFQWYNLQRRFTTKRPPTCGISLDESDAVCPQLELETANNNLGKFLKYAQSSDAAPVHFRRASDTSLLKDSNARELLRCLREAEDRVIDVELGRYDDTGSFEKVSMRLGQYLHWIESEQSSDGKVAGRQLYLAQWRASDEIPAVAQLIQPPPLLASLLKRDPADVDLYQKSFFIGPAGAITPLHYDPYFNLYQLFASSNPNRYAKHVFLLPPSAREFVMRADTQHSLRNTSSVHLSLKASPSGDKFDVIPESGTPSRSVEAISQLGLSYVLKEGETLLIPKGWWHRVENVVLEYGQDPLMGSGWTAAIGWWWLPRGKTHAVC